jgi:hypothetical protein
LAAIGSFLGAICSFFAATGLSSTTGAAAFNVAGPLGVFCFTCSLLDESSDDDDDDDDDDDEDDEEEDEADGA